MPQPSPLPAPSPALAPPQPPAVAPVGVQVGEVVVPFDGLPRTAEELQGLRERREILRDQLERAVNRRSELVGQLRRDGPAALGPDARAGVQQRLQLVDARILELERDQARTERQLSNASPEVLARAAADERSERPEHDEDEVVATVFGGFGLGVLLTLGVGRLRRRLARHRAGGSGAGARGGAAAPPLPAADPRIDRLTQAVEAIAEEVERIGEGQRFVTQLLASRQEPVSLPGGSERR